MGDGALLGDNAHPQEDLRLEQVAIAGKIVTDIGADLGPDPGGCVEIRSVDRGTGLRACGAGQRNEAERAGKVSERRHELILHWGKFGADQPNIRCVHCPAESARPFCVPVAVFS